MMLFSFSQIFIIIVTDHSDYYWEGAQDATFARTGS